MPEYRTSEKKNTKIGLRELKQFALIIMIYLFLDYLRGIANNFQLQIKFLILRIF